MKTPSAELMEREIMTLRARVRVLESSNKDLFKINDKLRLRIEKYEKQENQLSKVNT
jgi:DNA-directed RNA polymerase subunit E'/Rpb7